MATRKPKTPKADLQVETIKHDGDTRKNIPTAEFQSVVQREHQQQVQVSYERGAPAGPLQAERNARNRDLDPQLVWRGKDQQDWSDLVVNAPPLYIQEKVHPKVLIDDLKRQTDKAKAATEPEQQGFTADLFADMAKDFNGLPDDDAKTEFYAHDQHWSNRMILGDSLQVMASLAEREGLRGKVQCIYFDPPYGIKFNSNFQWSTTSKDVKDGNRDHITREPEMVKAFRDTWKDGIHSYLSYIRDRLTVARDLLTDSGSVFVQIGDENVHRVRLVLDEVFGDENFVAQIGFQTSSGRVSDKLDSVFDTVVWYAKNKSSTKFRKLYRGRSQAQVDQGYNYYEENGENKRVLKNMPVGKETLRRFKASQIYSQTPSKSSVFTHPFQGGQYAPSPGAGWRTSQDGLIRAEKANRVMPVGKYLSFKLFDDDFPFIQLHNIWTDTAASLGGAEKVYVVQTNINVVQRCLLMASDPGDLVLDPTCGSGTTAYVAEQWARRWITIDTSRVALALARARIMGTRYPFYMLADSKEGQIKEGEVTRTAPSSHPTYGNVRQGLNRPEF